MHACACVVALAVQPFLVCPGHAQTPAARAAEPGIIAPRRPTLDRPPVDVDLPPRPLPPAEVRDGEAIGVLAGVEITGVSIYSEAELAALYQPYLGQRIGVAQIAEIVAAITARYQEDGYILSRAVARPQDMEFGILRVDVIEGYIERVFFEGDINADHELLAAFAANLRAARPLSQRALERYVLLINDLPGVAAAPALRRNGQFSGGHDLVLTMDADRLEGRISLDNRGTAPVGPEIGELSLGFNSTLGLSERTGVYVYAAPGEGEELRSIEVVQDYVVNGEGTVVGVDGWRSRISPGGDLRRFDLKSVDKRIAVYVSHPVERSRDLSVYVTGTLEYRDTEEEIFGFNIYDDRIRSARLSLRSFFTDPWRGANLLVVTGSQGLDILEAGDNEQLNLSRRGGRIDYTKLEAAFTRWQQLTGDWSAELGVKGQRAASGTLSAEEFRAGGSQFGRAYDPSEISGDHGAAGYAELRRDLASDGEVVLAAQLYAFYDLAAAWNEDPVAGTLKRSIASAGFGARFVLPGQIRAELEVAQPLTSDVVGEGDDGDAARAFFSLSASF
jgi:hemolysin activation/secretion protein